MFPMVAEVAEFDAARLSLERELERERKRGGGVPDTVQIGVMLEVPALLFQLPMLLSRVDFVSIGTNDLAQFLFASDRGNPRLADRYDTLAPGFLGAIGEVARAASKHGIALSVCGEMAGSPIGAMALVGLGLRTLSMNPAGIGPAKTMIPSLTPDPLDAFSCHHPVAP